MKYMQCQHSVPQLLSALFLRKSSAVASRVVLVRNSSQAKNRELRGFPTLFQNTSECKGKKYDEVNLF